MSNIVDVYTAAVYSNLKPLRASWEPARPVRLGDYGPLSGNVFLAQGNVADLGVNIGQVIIDEVGDQKTFTSSSDVSVELTARGALAANPAATAKANLQSTFLWWSRTFKPLSTMMQGNPRLVSLQTEPPGDVHFGQLL